MFFIPGILISLITFPGVIVHELAHKLFCDFTKTKVLEVKYFRFGNPAGYVVHEIPTNVWKHMLIGVGPLFFNTCLGAFIGLASSPLRHAKGVGGVFFGLLTWLAVSIAMHSFPSTGDAKSIWSAIWSRNSPLLAKLIGTPVVGLIFLGAIGSIFWLDFFYGLGVVISFPLLMGWN